VKRLLLVFFVLAALVVLPFLLWGERFETALEPARLAEAFARARAWAWLAGLGLLVADILLPVPGTAVMSALGLVYGWWLGGLLSALGSLAAGLFAYGACRRLGRPAARWLAGEEGLEQGERLFSGELGGWIVALSRWMPVLPEVVACLAGLARLPLRRFVPALCAGSVPLGFVFAAVGAGGEARPFLALALSALLPPLLWFSLRRLWERRQD
jgi:uncharacterized membrane protein YdjX (TVP38/TMEM64 family)